MTQHLPPMPFGTHRLGLVLLAGAIILSVAAVPRPGAAGERSATPKVGPKTQSACGTCVEKRPVVDPELFLRGYPPQVRNAYWVARRYPAALDRIHCFCECQESSRFRHKTLLTCFTDSHAAACGICVEEALAAGELKVRGIPDAEIARRVEGAYRTEGHPPTKNESRR